jgi:gluconokinase
MVPTRADNVGGPPIVVLMGPAGAGKTTVGRELARRLHVPFEDADAFHTSAAIAKMRRGEALNDDDREPWLEALAQRLAAANDDGVVLACSALKAKYRARLQAGEPFRRGLAYLAVPADVLSTRLAERATHFAGPLLLASQLGTLEVPTPAETYDGTSSPELLVDEIVRRMNLRPRA